MDYTVHGILQARILEEVAFPFSRGSFHPRDQTQVSWILYQLSHKHILLQLRVYEKEKEHEKSGKTSQGQIRYLQKHFTKGSIP